MNWMKPISFQVPSRCDRYLFFDAFIKDYHLVLISTYYHDIRFEIAEVQVTLDDVPLFHCEEVGLNEYEPTRAFIFPLSSVTPRAYHILTVQYCGQTITESLVPEATDTHKSFTVATLFKYDYENIPTFYRYYKQQGVEKFYLYYNGDLSNVSSRLFVADDIVYGEWNFDYWINNIAPMHHAQTTFLTMIRHCYLSNCSYLALVDLDEFLAVPGETLRSYVERNVTSTLTARCYWAEVRFLERWMPKLLWQSKTFRNLLAWNSRVRRGFKKKLGFNVPPPVRFDDLRRIWASRQNEGSRREKTIYHQNYEGLFGIHTPKKPCEIHISSDLKLYHMVNMSADHNRFKLIHRDAEPLSLI